MSSRLLAVALLSLASLLPGPAFGEWSFPTEEVDNAADVGHWCSIAGTSGGVLHIAYWDATNEDLKYAKKFNGNWTIETVASANNSGQYCALALDSSGQPHISYRWQYLNDYEIRYSWRSATVWTTETIASGDNHYSSIGVDDGSGDVHVSYYTGSDLKYALRTSGAWTLALLDETGDVGRWTSIAVNSSNVPYISYMDWTNRTLKLAKKPSSTWILTVEDAGAQGPCCNNNGTSDVGGYSSIDLLNDAVRIGYHDGTLGGLRYKTSAVQCWASGDGGCAVCDERGMGMSCSIEAVTSTNTYVVFATQPPTGGGVEVRFFETGNSGTCILVDGGSAEPAGGSVSLCQR